MLMVLVVCLFRQYLLETFDNTDIILSASNIRQHRHYSECFKHLTTQTLFWVLQTLDNTDIILSASNIWQHKHYSECFKHLTTQTLFWVLQTFDNKTLFWVLQTFDNTRHYSECFKHLTTQDIILSASNIGQWGQQENTTNRVETQA